MAKVQAPMVRMRSERKGDRCSTVTAALCARTAFAACSPSSPPWPPCKHSMHAPYDVSHVVLVLKESIVWQDCKRIAAMTAKAARVLLLEPHAANILLVMSS